VGAEKGQAALLFLVDRSGGIDQRQPESGRKIRRIGQGGMIRPENCGWLTHITEAELSKERPMATVLEEIYVDKHYGCKAE
jgi:hypothetical protein